jgi:hypothetical protein
MDTISYYRISRGGMPAKLLLLSFIPLTVKPIPRHRRTMKNKDVTKGPVDRNSDDEPITHPKDHG